MHIQNERQSIIHLFALFLLIALKYELGFNFKKKLFMETFIHKISFNRSRIGLVAPETAPFWEFLGFWGKFAIRGAYRSQLWLYTLQSTCWVRNWQKFIEFRFLTRSNGGEPQFKSTAKFRKIQWGLSSWSYAGFQVFDFRWEQAKFSKSRLLFFAENP